MRTKPGLKKNESCGFKGQFGNILQSACFLHTMRSSDSATYWCEDRSGNSSQKISVIVTDAPLILDSPALPVQAGSDVTMRCRSQQPQRPKAVIFKNGSLFHSSAELTLRALQSHEGCYSCHAHIRVQSAGSRLRVRGVRGPASSGSVALSPNTQQVFREAENFNSGCNEQWILRKSQQSASLQIQSCDQGSSSQSSSCEMFSEHLYESTTYWCEPREEREGSRGEDVQVIVSDGPVILESPALPVEEGSEVTLRCRTKYGADVKPEIYKDGVVFQHTAEFTFRAVQKSDEGIYSCFLQTTLQSPQSCLTVTGHILESPSPPGSSPDPSSSLESSVSVFCVLQRLLVVTPYVICTVLHVLICRSIRSGKTVLPNTLKPC